MYRHLSPELFASLPFFLFKHWSVKSMFCLDDTPSDRYCKTLSSRSGQVCSKDQKREDISALGTRKPPQGFANDFSFLYNYLWLIVLSSKEFLNCIWAKKHLESFLLNTILQKYFLQKVKKNLCDWCIIRTKSFYLFLSEISSSLIGGFSNIFNFQLLQPIF